MLDQGVFQRRPVKDVQYKITALEYFDKTLFVGDSNGLLYSYQVSLSPEIPDIIQKNSVEKNERISKNKIDSIKASPQASVLLVQSDGVLYQVSTKFLQKSSKPIHPSIGNFCLNQHGHEFVELIVVTKKKEAIIFQYDFQTLQFFQSEKTFHLTEIPSSMSWLDTKIIVAQKSEKKYYMLDTKTMEKKLLQIPVDQNAVVLATNIDEFLLVTSNNVGIYIGLDEQMKFKSALSMSAQKQILSMNTNGLYLIVLFDNLVQVFSTFDSALLQEVKLNDPAKAFSYANDRQFFATISEIFYLQLTPYQLLIQKCLSQLRIEDAFQIFNQNVTNLTNQEKLDQLEHLKQDAVWNLLKNLKFTQAKQYIIETNFDPREFIILFPDYIFNQNDFYTKDQKKFYTMPLLINENLQSKTQKLSNINQELQIQLEQSKVFLKDILQNRRQFYQLNFSDFSEKITFTTSKNQISGTQFKPTNIEETLQMIDYALIQLYVDLKEYEKLNSLLSEPIFLTNQMQKEILSKLLDIQKSHPQLLAKYYLQCGKTEEALQTWRSIGTKGKQEQIDQACDQILIIFKDCQDIQLIYEYLKWVLLQNQEYAQTCFQNISEDTISPDQMMGFLSDFNEEIQSYLKQIYLEILVHEKKVTDERFHTALAIYYIDTLFKLKAKNSDFEIMKSDPNYQQINEYKEKFNQFLKNPESKYRANILLDRIKDSWLLMDEIYLYGREKQHNVALQKLVNKKEYLMAENYCADRDEGLLTVLFCEIYIKVLNQIEKKIKEQPNNDQAKKFRDDVMIKTINEFLKKYATHPQLDPIKVLEYIPDNWILSETGENDGLYAFLKQITSHQLNKKRNMKCANYMSEMDLKYIECDLAQAKKANIRITQEKNCSVCQRRIGDKVFVVYPNGVTAHHTCVSSKGLSLCPQTGQNFDKTYND